MSLRELRQKAEALAKELAGMEKANNKLIDAMQQVEGLELLKSKGLRLDATQSRSLKSAKAKRTKAKAEVKTRMTKVTNLGKALRVVEGLKQDKKLGVAQLSPKRRRRR